MSREPIDIFREYRKKKSGQPWSMAEAVRIGEEGHKSGRPVAIPSEQKLWKFTVFSALGECASWKTAQLSADEATEAAYAYRRLNKLCGQLLGVAGAWAMKVKEPDFVESFAADIRICFAVLENDDERIESLTAILARIVKLHADRHIVLSASERGLFTRALINAAWSAHSALAAHPELQRQIESIGKPDAGASQPLPERWRELRENETAPQFFDRIIAPIPFESRPTTTALMESDPPLYKTLAATCAYNVKTNRVGHTELERARGIADLFPMAARKRQRRGPQ